ncbi:MAG: hypothetical protein C4521_09410 [Actinobacteria bacterium]|nr:MAG: hypothetical protein C4521_09410 [Actinomycetota bacterium]
MTTILLLGAGASRPLGYPTTTEFFGSKNEWERDHQQVMDRLRAQTRLELLDVEQVLEIVEPAAAFLATPSGKFLAHKLTEKWAENDPLHAVCQGTLL